MSPRPVDLNGDVGEGMTTDPEFIPLLTSANIACGGHAGDEASMRKAIECARAAGVAIGAHPSFPDREHFGRKEHAASPLEVRRWTVEQVSSLKRLAEEAGVRLAHVKPHGALYNQAAREPAMAAAIVDAIVSIDDSIILFALANSVLVEAGKRRGIRVAAEGFADRAYLANGQLAPRTVVGAVFEDEALIAAQALRLARAEPLRSLDGGRVELRIDTLCLHGDGAQAVVMARRIRELFEKEKIPAQSCGHFLGPGTRFL